MKPKTREGAVVSVDAEVGVVTVQLLAQHRVLRLDRASGTISCVAGTGTKGYSGDGKTATAAELNEPYEVRVRVAGRTESLREAVRIGNEVETLYTNGPAAGGGVTKSARDVVAVASVLLEIGRASCRERVCLLV